MNDQIASGAEAEVRPASAWKMWLVLAIVGGLGLAGIGLMAKLTGIQPKTPDAGVKAQPMPTYAKITQPLVAAERSRSRPMS
jgi:hypothetical protein